MQILSEQEVAEVHQDGITVTKAALDLGRDHVSGVKLTVSSSAEDPVAVEIIEEVPGHVSLGEIQVHPNYGPRKWSKSEAHHRMEFHDEIPAGGTVVTIYGVRQTYEELDPFVDDPSIASVEPTDRETVDGNAIDLGDVDLGTEAEPEPSPANGTPPDETPGQEAASGSPHSADTPPDGESAPERAGRTADSPSDPDPEPQESGDGDSTAPDPGANNDRPESPSSQFEFGEDRQRESLHRTDEAEPRMGPEAAGGSRPTPGELTGRATPGRTPDATREESAPGGDIALQVQLEHLQSSVARLSAFADAFDQFVGEEGAPSEVVAELRSKQQDLVAEVEALTERVRTNAAERAALEEQVDQLEAAIDDLRESRETRIDSLTDRIEELESTFTAEETQAIREVIAAERAWRQQRMDGGQPRMTVAPGERGR